MILDLGAHLGLNSVRLKNKLHSSTFVNDVIAAWVRKEDKVLDKGEPTWRNVAMALEHPRIRQGGVADEIKRKMF